jgi:hypothetical protein
MSGIEKKWGREGRKHVFFDFFCVSDPTQVGVSDIPQTAKKKGQKVDENAFFLIEIGFHTLPTGGCGWEHFF